ncbi:MAG: hypothetical protein ABSE62_08635 [Chthoniobacteraceae bacterium]
MAQGPRHGTAKLRAAVAPGGPRGDRAQAADRWQPADQASVERIRQARSANWPELRRGTQNELAELNRQRGLSIEAMREAEERGFLHFGEFCGRTFWSITDGRRELIELRRVTGELWPAYRPKGLVARKAHCIGAGKAWPIGIAESKRFPALALVEGAPDFVAAIHFAQIEGKSDTVAPVAMLGAGAARIAAEALIFFEGKHVRLFPHLDEAGRQASRKWAKQIAEAGAARVDAFDFARLVRDDGAEGKDLADVCRIAPECYERHRKFSMMLP